MFLQNLKTFSCIFAQLKIISMQDIIIATHNQHKVKEIQPLIPANYRLLSLQDIGFDTPIEEPFEVCKILVLILL